MPTWTLRKTSKISYNYVSEKLIVWQCQLIINEVNDLAKEKYPILLPKLYDPMDLLELIMQTDDFLTRQVAANIILAYVLIFVIIFAESGIILFPFLPGDGFLFSVGVIAASTDLNFYIVVPICILAAILGYLINYYVGKVIGNGLLKRNYYWFRRFYQQTHRFMQIRGSNAVILSRFFPIIRTYFPFVAGMADMEYKKFVIYTILGAVLWVLIFAFTGFMVGEIPWVQQNYGFIFLGLVILTLIPLMYSSIRHFYRRLYKR
jgi:membrane-associated protein